MITVTTVLKTSDVYTYKWVDKLKSGLEKHLKIPFNFLPISDFPHEFSHNSFIQENKKYWNKIELFRPGLYTGKTLYFDLDTVLVGDITDIVKSFQGSPFLMYKDTYHNSGALSGIMYWEGDQSHLWNTWVSQPQRHWYKKYAGGSLGDQAFIRDNVQYEFIQDKIKNKDHIYFASGKEPKDVDMRILVYGGKYRKPHVSDWQIVKQEWV
jgi:hypothetical protein